MFQINESNGAISAKIPKEAGRANKIIKLLQEREGVVFSSGKDLFTFLIDFYEKKSNDSEDSQKTEINPILNLSESIREFLNIEFSSEKTLDECVLLLLDEKTKEPIEIEVEKEVEVERKLSENEVLIAFEADELSVLKHIQKARLKEAERVHHVEIKSAEPLSLIVRKLLGQHSVLTHNHHKLVGKDHFNQFTGINKLTEWGRKWL